MGRKKQKGLNEKHKKVLGVLEYYDSEVGYPPTIREICDRASLSSTSVANYYLERLEEKGYIERDRGVSRGLRLVKPFEDSIKSVGEHVRASVNAVKTNLDELLSIPIAGRIVASEPLFTPSSDFGFTDFEGSAINIAKSMLPAQDQKQGSLFALEVSGDSMIDAMVNDGDIVNIDVTSILNGYYADANKTFFVGTPDADATKIVSIARECLKKAMSAIKPGHTLGDIGWSIQIYAEAQGCSVVREFVGHGVGFDFHEAPQIPHFGNKGAGITLIPGMIFTVEPMINLGKKELRVLDDNWTAVTKDGSLSAQFEQTLLVTEDGCESLTPYEL